MCSFVTPDLAGSTISEPRISIRKQGVKHAATQGRIGHFSVDLNNQRLFVAALGNKEVWATKKVRSFLQRVVS
jgi:hypothetical protein